MGKELIIALDKGVFFIILFVQWQRKRGVHISPLKERESYGERPLKEEMWKVALEPDS